MQRRSLPSRRHPSAHLGTEAQAQGAGSSLRPGSRPPVLCLEDVAALVTARRWRGEGGVAEFSPCRAVPKARPWGVARGPEGGGAGAAASQRELEACPGGCRGHLARHVQARDCPAQRCPGSVTAPWKLETSCRGSVYTADISQRSSQACFSSSFLPESWLPLYQQRLPGLLLGPSRQGASRSRQPGPSPTQRAKWNPGEPGPLWITSTCPQEPQGCQQGDGGQALSSAAASKPPAVLPSTHPPTC